MGTALQLTKHSEYWVLYLIDNTMEGAEYKILSAGKKKSNSPFVRPQVLLVLGNSFCLGGQSGSVLSDFHCNLPFGPASINVAVRGFIWANAAAQGEGT